MVINILLFFIFVYDIIKSNDLLIIKTKIYKFTTDGVFLMTKNEMNRLTASEIYMGLLLCAIAVFIPMICKLVQVDISSDELNVIRSEAMRSDVFAKCKSTLIIVMGTITLISAVFDVLSGESMKIKWNSLPLLLSGIYLVFMLISCVFSKYHHTAFFGITERYEGFFVWLSYFVFMIAAMNFADREDKAALVVGGLTICGILLGLIGALQKFGINIFEFTPVQKIIMGDKYQPDSMKFAFDSVFATMYNPNSASMFYGMMTAFLAVSAAAMPVKNVYKYFMAGGAVLCLIALIGTDSVGGFMGASVGILFACATLLWHLVFRKRNKLAIGIAVGALAVVVIAVGFVLNSNNKISQKVRIITDTVLGNNQLEKSDSFYQNISVDGMKGSIETLDGVYSIDYAGYATQFMYNGEVLSPISEETMQGTDDGVHYVYKGSDIQWNMYIYNSEVKNATLVSIVAEELSGHETYFLFGEFDGKLCVLDKFNNPIDISSPAESFGFKGIERLGSNRGYIWSRSIPLLKKYILIGAGCDSFALAFPQWDVVNKLKFLSNPYIIVDKPHNMYLQIGINTGVVSLIIMLGLFGYYILETTKRVLDGSSKSVMALRLGTLAGVTAYLIAGLTTDSMVAVAPVFWMMLGLGFGINYIEGDGNEQNS